MFLIIPPLEALGERGGFERLVLAPGGGTGETLQDPASAVSATVYGANTIATSTTPNTGTNVNVYDGGTV